MAEAQPQAAMALPEKAFPVSWDQFHRDARALAWRLTDKGPFEAIVCITRGGLVPAVIVARELDLRLVETVCVSSYEHKAQGQLQVLKGVAASVQAIGNGKGYSGLRNDQYHLKGASKAEIGAYIRANAGTYYHYSGTCSMGKDARAPVDEALRVRGVARLRVVDASVIPEAPCCNTNPAVLSLAERAAELMLAGG